jgi:predicted transcriptional regulator
MKVHQTTIYDIAKELNISKSTVSRALTNHPEVKIETRKAVLELAEKLDYQRRYLLKNLPKLLWYFTLYIYSKKETFSFSFYNLNRSR